jgi:hypothetical protein
VRAICAAALLRLQLATAYFDALRIFNSRAFDGGEHQWNFE